jgi:hypothetical protein
MSEWKWGKFTEEDYWYIRRSPLSRKQLAEKLGCASGHIHYIRHRNLGGGRKERFCLRYALLIVWERVTRNGRRDQPGWRHRTRGSAKLTDNDVQRIRAMGARGVTQTAIGEQFGVGQDTVHCILSRKTWKHVA